MTTLAIDAGNTRIKWGLFDINGLMVEQGACLHADLAKLALPKASKVVISNVAGVAIAEQLKSLLHQYANIHWVKTQASACGVSNGYAKPETLGTDRWAALIAAWHLKQAPCVVVNAGTAVTVDALNAQGNFIGGLILPGLDLMQKSLGIAAAQLTIQNPATQNLAKKDVEIFATNTADAIYAGSVYAITGAIELIHLELNKKDAVAPFILISGGNSAVIYSRVIKTYLMGDVTKQVFIVDNLVLHGLYLLEN